MEGRTYQTSRSIDKRVTVNNHSALPLSNFDHILWTNLFRKILVEDDWL